MNISKRKQGILAIICTIAMIVTSITVYNPREVKADPSATVDGKQYSATVKDSGEWTGFACQGIFDSARIHFAWGIAVDAATITASLNGNQLKVAGQNANGMYIPLTEVTNLEVGSYDIVVTATTVATKTAEAKEVSATATLKIEKVEGTTELQKPSAPTSLVANINNLKTDYIDLYYLHRVDPNVPIEDIAYLMKNCIKQVKIKHWGLSEAGIETKPMQYVL